MELRSYRSTDQEQILTLFYETVHSVNLRDYSPAQADAWAPKNPDRERWERNLSGQDTLVVEQNGKIIGFANWDRADHFDCLYVHRDFQGMGVASLLANEIERRARHAGTHILRVEASITARPFFEKRGYAVTQEQQVERLGQKLKNYKMEKNFSL